MNRIIRFTCVSFLVGFLLTVSFGFAQDSQNVELLDRIGGAYHAVAIQGNYAYMAEAGGLTILNISIDSSPQLVGMITLPSSAYGVAVSGNYAYVADEYSGLQIVNISNPASPNLVGSYATGLYAYGVTVSGNFAYMAESSGIQIINISNPASPTLAGSYTTQSYAESVAVSGDYAYVAESSGLQIINISNPASLTLAGSLAGSYLTPSYSQGIVVSGNYAYVADVNAGLQIINISTASSPTLAGSYNPGGGEWANGVAVNGNYAYVADGNLDIINISTASSPTLVGSYTTNATVGVAVSGNYVYVVNYDSGLEIINSNTASSPTLAGSYTPPNIGANSIAVQGIYAYVGEDIINISNPALPVFATTSSYGGEDIAVSGNYAYVAGGNDLAIVNISNPALPTLAGSITMPHNPYYGVPYGVAVSGNYAYVAAWNEGLQIINVSIDSSLTNEGSYVNSLYAYAVAVSGNYAYVTDAGGGIGGLDIINISTASSSALVGSYTTSWVWGVAVSGNYAYLAESSELQIVNISNPASPTLTGSYPTGNANGVVVSGDYAYVATESGLQILNISDPALPTLAGYYNMPVTANGIAVNGNYVYVTSEASGFWIFQNTLAIPPQLTQVPALKLFANQSITHAFDLDDYNTGGIVSSYSILSNFLDLSSLDSSSVNQNAYGSATTGINFYLAQNVYGEDTATNEVKYSTYKIYKLPHVGLTVGSSWDMNMANYTYNSTGLALPPSFGMVDALSTNNPAITASWLNNSTVQITTNSAITSAANVYVTASPSTTAPFGNDVDVERIQVYTNLLANSTFSSANDTTAYGLQLAPGRSTMATQSWITTYTDSVGIQANGVWKFTFADANGGVKSTPTTSNWINITNGQWYIFRMRLVADSTNNSHQSFLYGYTNIPATGVQTDIAANVLFGVPTVWTWQETPLLAHGTGTTGYPQFQLKAGGAGNIYVDEIQIINATPSLLEARSNTHFHYLYGQFNTPIDTTGWGQQIYSGAASAPIITVNDGLELNFAGATSTALEGIKWTANNAVQGNAYSFQVHQDNDVNLALTVSSIQPGNFNSLGIVLLAAYGIQTAGQQDIGIVPSSLIAVAGVGVLENGNYYAEGDAVNPYYQAQFGIRSDLPGVLVISNVDVNVDNDDPNFGDPTLFP